MYSGPSDHGCQIPGPLICCAHIYLLYHTYHILTSLFFVPLLPSPHFFSSPIPIADRFFWSSSSSSFIQTICFLGFLPNGHLYHFLYCSCVESPTPHSFSFFFFFPFCQALLLVAVVVSQAAPPYSNRELRDFRV